MQARLRAQLGDRSEYSGERRRRSVVVASIVLTTTDPLRGSNPFWFYLQAALIRSCGASFACMELTIISRFQRLQTSRKYSLHSLFYSFSVLSPLACFDANTNVSTHWKHTIRRTSLWWCGDFLFLYHFMLLLLFAQGRIANGWFLRILLHVELYPKYRI